MCWGVSITETGKTRRDISVSKKEKKRFSCRAVLINRERLWKSIRRNPRREHREPVGSADSHADPRFTSAAVQTVRRK